MHYGHYERLPRPGRLNKRTPPARCISSHRMTSDERFELLSSPGGPARSFGGVQDSASEVGEPVNVSLESR